MASLTCWREVSFGRNGTGLKSSSSSDDDCSGWPTYRVSKSNETWNTMPYLKSISTLTTLTKQLKSRISHRSLWSDTHLHLDRIQTPKPSNAHEMTCFNCVPTWTVPSYTDAKVQFVFAHERDTKIHEIARERQALQGSFLQVELPLVTTHAKLLNPLASHKANN